MNKKLILFVLTFANLNLSYALNLDKRPCGKVIDKCIRETRTSELGGCLGTAYGLYFAGEDGISNCSKGKYTIQCLQLDQMTALQQCMNLGAFPTSCTSGVYQCINEFSAAQ